MKKTKTTVLLVLSLFLIGGALQAGNPERNSKELLQVAAHQRIIMFRSNALSWEAREKIIRDSGGKPVRRIALINAIVAYYEKEVSRDLFSHREVLNVVSDGIANLIEPIRFFSAEDPAQTVPWGVERVKAASKWKATFGREVLVCVVDTGIQADHPDLQGLTVGGENLYDPNTPTNINDENGHGTHVFGTMAALNNSIGVVGMSPYATRLFVSKVFGTSGSTTWSTVVAGIDSCVRNRAKVINMSLGGRATNEALAAAVKKAYDAGLVVVAAAGNESGGAVLYPAAYPEAIAVSASDIDNKFAYFSSKGPEVDIIAPGAKIPSTIPGSRYASFSGTSMASPHVAGAAALILAIQPSLNPKGVRGVLESCTTSIGLPKEEQGQGLLDFGAGSCMLPNLVLATRPAASSGLSNIKQGKRESHLRVKASGELQSIFGN